MFYIIAILLIGINISPILMTKVPIWFAHGIFAQAIILIGFCWSLFENKQVVKYKNLPLALLSSWIVFYTMLWFYLIMPQAAAAFSKFLFFSYHSMIRYVCIIILYCLIVQHLNREHIKRLLLFIKYVILMTLFMCVLQKFNCAQFFRPIADTLKGIPVDWHVHHNNMIVGFLGNGTHLTGFLGSLIPVFLYFGKREDYLAIAFMLLTMCFLGTTVGDTSISGFIVAFCTFLFFFKDKKRFVFCTIILAFVSLLFVWRFLPPLFLSDSGRINLWKTYWLLFKADMPITGKSLGAISAIYKQTAVPTARHLHMELFHFTFELGIIGGVLILNLIKHFFDIKTNDRLELTLKTMVVGFLVSSCFNYPAHLWLPATYAMFAYASLCCLKNKGLTCQYPAERKLEILS